MARIASYIWPLNSQLLHSSGSSVWTREPSRKFRRSPDAAGRRYFSICRRCKGSRAPVGNIPLRLLSTCGIYASPCILTFSHKGRRSRWRPWRRGGHSGWCRRPGRTSGCCTWGKSWCGRAPPGICLLPCSPTQLKNKTKGDLGRMRGWSERLRLITTAYNPRCNFKNPANPRRRHRIINWKGWLNCAFKFFSSCASQKIYPPRGENQLNVDGLPATIGKMTSSPNQESFAINICLIPNCSRNHPSRTDSSRSEDDHNGNCSHGELWFSR